jgi:hypothetical protein
MENPKKYSEKAQRKEDGKKSGLQNPGNPSLLKPLFAPHYKSIFAKMEISQPEDDTEVQADEMADSFMRGDMEYSQQILSQPVSDISRKGDNSNLQTSDAFEQELQSTRGQGQKLDDGIKGELEQHTGTDLSGVNIHTGPKSHDLNEEINSKAFAIGPDIHFGKGNYNPQSAEGKSLLAHEVAHTVQQTKGVGRGIQRVDKDPITEDQKKYMIYLVLKNNGLSDISSQDMDILIKTFPESKYPYGVTILPPEKFIFCVQQAGIFGASEKMSGRRIVPYNDIEKTTINLDPIDGMEIYAPAIDKGRNYIIRAPSTSSPGYTSLVFDAGGDLPYLKNTQIPTIFGRILSGKQITGIDAFFISHTDGDHINAFPTVFFMGAKYSLTEGQRTQVRISLEQLQSVSSWKELLLNPGGVGFTTISSKSETELLTIDVSTFDALEVTEIRLNKTAIENLPANDPNKIPMDANAQSPMSFVRNTKTGESAIFTADLTEPALKIILEQIGEIRFVELAGKGLIFLEYPHHGGKVEDGEATFTLIRLSMQASSGKVVTVTQTSKSFAEGESNSIDMFSRLGVNIKEISGKSNQTIARISSNGFETQNLSGGAPENILLERSGNQGVYNLAYVQRGLLETYIKSYEAEEIPFTEKDILSRRDQELSELRNKKNELDAEIAIFETNLDKVGKLTGRRYSKIQGNAEAESAWDIVLQSSVNLGVLNTSTQELVSRQSSFDHLLRIRDLMDKNRRRLIEVETEDELIEIQENLESLETTGEEVFGEDAEFSELWGRTLRSSRLSTAQYAALNPNLSFGPTPEGESVEAEIAGTSQYFVRQSRASRGVNWNPITIARANSPRIAIGGLLMEIFNLGVDVYKGVKGMSDSYDRENDKDRYEAAVYLEWWARFRVYPDFIFVDKGGDIIEGTENLSKEEKYKKLQDETFKGSYWRIGINTIKDEEIDRALALAALQSSDLSGFLSALAAPYAVAPINYDESERKWMLRLFEDGEYKNVEQTGLHDKVMELYYIMWQEMQNNFTELNTGGRKLYTVKNTATLGVDREITVFEAFAPGFGSFKEVDLESGINTVSGTDVFDTDIPLFWSVNEIYDFYYTYQYTNNIEAVPGSGLITDKILVQAADAKTWEALYNYSWPGNVHTVAQGGYSYTNWLNSNGFAYVSKSSLVPLTSETAKDSRAITDPFSSNYSSATIDNLKKKQAPQITPKVEPDPIVNDPGKDNTTVAPAIDPTITMNPKEPASNVTVGHDTMPANTKGFYPGYYIKSGDYHPQFVKFLLENNLMLNSELFYDDLVGDRPTFSFPARFRIKNLYLKEGAEYYSNDKKDANNKLIKQAPDATVQTESWDFATVILDEDYSIKVHDDQGKYITTIYIRKGNEYKWYFDRVKWNQTEPQSSQAIEPDKTEIK